MFNEFKSFVVAVTFKLLKLTWTLSDWSIFTADKRTLTYVLIGYAWPWQDAGTLALMFAVKVVVKI